MQMLFLDESGTAPNKNDVSKSPYFVLGGIIVLSGVLVHPDACFDDDQGDGDAEEPGQERCEEFPAYPDEDDDAGDEPYEFFHCFHDVCSLHC